MIAFFCATPFQIMNAIVIKENGYSDMEVMVYILDYFDGAEDYVEKLESVNIFKEVKFVRAWDMYQKAYGTHKKGKLRFIDKLKQAMWRAYYYIKYEKVLENLKIEKNLEQVFFSYGDPICHLLGRYEYKKNAGLHFVGYEDGSGSYLNELDIPIGKVERIFHIPQRALTKEAYWVYRPDQIVNPGKYVGRIYPMKIHDVKAIDRVFDDLWKSASQRMIDEDYIYFDNLDDIDELEYIIPKIVEICGIENILFKEHPRRRDGFYKKKGLNLWKSSSIPFEAILTKQDIGDKVLITNYSSACFNPKFIFDQEPTVIFLYKIIGFPKMRDAMQPLVDKLLSIYTDKSKIYIPDNMDEFITQLLFLHKD